MTEGGGAVGRTAGLVGAAIGFLAAGAAAGVAIERMTVGRATRREARLALDAAGPFGTLRGEPGTVRAEDGTELVYEVEEPWLPGEPGGPFLPSGNGIPYGDGVPLGDGVPSGDGGPSGGEPLTVVFCHGYCLHQDSWHFQRAMLRGHVRAVYWDQRSHGRSARGRDQAAGRPATIDQLGRDLRAVIEAAAPRGPLVLAGHSMGGMAVMAFVDQFPELVAERVVGVFFAGTSAGKLAAVTLGLPAVGARAFRALAPGVLRAMGAQVGLVERGRRVTADLFAGIIKHYAFASEVDPSVARLAERMIESTPIDVVAEFYPAFTTHEKADSLARMNGVPALVVAGDHDLLTPSEHSAEIAECLPGSQLVIVPDAGHLVMLEYPEIVNARLAALLVRAAEAAGVPLADRIRRLAPGPDPAGAAGE